MNCSIHQNRIRLRGRLIAEGAGNLPRSPCRDMKWRNRRYPRPRPRRPDHPLLRRQHRRWHEQHRPFCPHVFLHGLNPDTFPGKSLGGNGGGGGVQFEVLNSDKVPETDFSKWIINPRLIK